jgi:hypothetical protein
MTLPKPGTLLETGAPAGAILTGIDDVNRGLRVRILKQQKSGHSGWIEGAFELLDAGMGTYAIAIRPFVGEQFVNVRELLDRVRAAPGAHKATHLLNGNTLRVESSS